MADTDTHTDTILRLDNYWPYQISVLADRIARRTSTIVKAHGLNLSQWRVMAAIGEVPGRSSVDVVTLTPMDKGIVSRATKALLELGLARREASQEDGRISHLYLTEKGRALYGTVVPQVEAILQRATENLSSAEQNRLSESLGALIKVIPDLR